MELPDISAIRLEQGGHDTLQKQLFTQVQARIASRQWPAGTQLPPSRDMARELGLSRNTVVAVIEQLKGEGYLRSKPGSGVFVDDQFPQSLAVPSTSQQRTRPAAASMSRYAGKLYADSPRLRSAASYPFTLGVPDLKAFPLQVWARLVRQHASRTKLLGYDHYCGYQPLREALAEYLRLSRNLRCSAEQILITHGAQQAISLCAAVFLDQGDTVIVENPGYIRAREAFLAFGARLLPARVAENGLDVTRLPKTTDAKLLYTTPTHQYPLGGIMPASDRQRLLDWAVESNTWIMEDDYDSEFHFYGKPISALQGMQESAPVLYIGSFSKTLFPALRLGYLVVPAELVPLFEQAKAHSIGETSLLEQAVVADFIMEGHFARHLRKMRKNYQAKWEHVMQLVDTRLGPRARPVMQSAGMHMVMALPGVNDRKLEQAMIAGKFGGSALSAYYFRGRRKTGYAIGFANSDVAQREQGIGLLASRLDAFSAA